MADIVIIKEPVSVVTVIQSVSPLSVDAPGLQGPPGAEGPPGEPGVGSDVRFEHIQVAPASDWVILHGLGLNPAVTVIVDDEEVEADIHYNSLNSVTVHFSSPQSGKAILN